MATTNDPPRITSRRLAWGGDVLTDWDELPCEPAAAQEAAAEILAKWGWPPAAHSDPEEVQAA